MIKAFIKILVFTTIVPVHLFAAQTHPLSIAINGETTRFMSSHSHFTGGLGCAMHLQYDLTQVISLVGGFGYAKLGEDHGLGHFDVYSGAYKTIYDMPVELGTKIYFGGVHSGPYGGMLLTYHTIWGAYYHVIYPGITYKDNNYGKDNYLRLSPFLGFEVTIGSRWAANLQISYRSILDYYLTPFQLGLRYSIGR